jgi:hypothetical protein
VRDRHNGAIRNPWDEVECGHHYARAMSSWSLLTAFSGCVWSAPAKELRFRPRTSRKNFRSLYCAGSAWGSYSQTAGENGLEIRLRVEKGELALATLRIPSPGKRVELSGHDGATARVSDGEAYVTFAAPVKLKAGSELQLHLRASRA